MSLSILQFADVTKTHSIKFSLKNVSFNVTKGTLTTLVGPNGAGKSTIAKLILGLEQPSSGQIVIQPNLRFGYVPQNLKLNPNLPLTSKNFLDLLAPNKDITNRLELKSFANYEDIKNSSIDTLSNGQLQKLLISATLLNNPNFIVLDEPTQSLDVASQLEFYQLIDFIKSNFGMTIFMISHDLHTVMKNSDHVICLNGHICCSGKPKELNTNKEFIDAMSTIGLYIHDHDHKH